LCTIIMNFPIIVPKFPTSSSKWASIKVLKLCNIAVKLRTTFSKLRVHCC
jgi:hypothetical protein